MDLITAKNKDSNLYTLIGDYWYHANNKYSSILSRCRVKSHCILNGVTFLLDTTGRVYYTLFCGRHITLQIYMNRKCVGIFTCDSRLFAVAPNCSVYDITDPEYPMYLQLQFHDYLFLGNIVSVSNFDDITLIGDTAGHQYKIIKYCRKSLIIEKYNNYIPIVSKNNDIIVSCDPFDLFMDEIKFKWN